MTSFLERNPQGTIHDAGFTLIELLVVITILGLMAGLVVAYLPNGNSALNLKSAASELAAEMRLARARAIASDRPVAVRLNVASHCYRVDNDPVRCLPANLSVAALTVADAQ